MFDDLLHSKILSFLCDHQGPVYKFFKEEDHANTLARGDVYLSTLGNCRAYETPERGDPEEGYETYSANNLSGGSNDPQFVEQARRGSIIIQGHCDNIQIGKVTRVASLEDAYVLCTTTEFSPENLNEEFGRFCVEIKDPREFFIAVSNKINSRSAIRQAAIRKVIYADRKYTGLDEPPGPMGFVKPSSPYEKQKEFRFLWVMERMGELNPPLLSCPEISSLCRRIA